MRAIEYRDIWPDGTVLVSWVCPEGQDFGYDYSHFGPENYPASPWDRQRREPDGEWVTVGGVRADGSSWRVLPWQHT